MRTIILASWDAEEYGLIGSTEFAEDHGDWLSNRSEPFRLICVWAIVSLDLIRSDAMQLRHTSTWMNQSLEAASQLVPRL